MYKETCLRCDGKGELWQFKHVLGGRCFKCNGDGFVLLKHKRKLKPPVRQLTEEEIAIIEANNARYYAELDLAEEMAADVRFDHAFKIIEALVDKKGDFVKAIMRDIVYEGGFPRGKGADIVVRIMGEHMGEEAAKTEFERVEKLLKRNK